MAKSPVPLKDLSYEQALDELDQLLASLEAESKDLESTVAMFERGKDLIKCCQNLLDKAELKVRQLTDNGEIIDFTEQG